MAMKEIVVAIDFSKGSVRALEYAIELSNLTHAGVTMVWVDNISINDIALPADTKDLRNEAKKNLEELVEHYKDSLKHAKLAFKVRKGKVYQELATFVKQYECALMIVGAHGQSGFEEYWIGTNAFRIVSSASCPIITVKSNYDIQRGFRKILLPVDHTQQTIQKVSYVAALAKATAADVNILAINTSTMRSLQKVVDSNVARVKRQLENSDVNYMVDTIASENLAADIIEHARLVDADLIAIMKDGNDKAATIMLGQYAQQLVNYSPVPVLSIQPNNAFSIL